MLLMFMFIEQTNLLWYWLNSHDKKEETEISHKS
jgi:hypothetical protein